MREKKRLAIEERSKRDMMSMSSIALKQSPSDQFVEKDNSKKDDK